MFDFSRAKIGMAAYVACFWAQCSRDYVAALRVLSIVVAKAHDVVLAFSRADALLYAVPAGLLCGLRAKIAHGCRIFVQKLDDSVALMCV